MAFAVINGQRYDRKEQLAYPPPPASKTLSTQRVTQLPPSRDPIKKDNQAEK